eukprot:GHVU01206731.1.p1 GENE.GHVU01206731.1~~GHVU01206731.1.p1  ORF type:complete len:108 (+),score=2.33 GHVU01206731.1:742-1065(+)
MRLAILAPPATCPYSSRCDRYLSPVFLSHCNDDTIPATVATLIAATAAAIVAASIVDIAVAISAIVIVAAAFVGVHNMVQRGPLRECQPRRPLRQVPGAAWLDRGPF